MSFILDERLQKDTILLTRLPLCHLLLMNDSQFPWFILVPSLAGITELHHLSVSQQRQFSLESGALSKFLEELFTPETLNIAALGNVVRQLHVHHVARFTSDKAWPKPIWGLFEPQPYMETEIQALKESCLGFCAIRNLLES